MTSQIDRERCTDCAICFDLCPGDCFWVDGTGQVDIQHPDCCWYCGCCERECPEGAITIRLPFVTGLG